MGDFALRQVVFIPAALNEGPTAGSIEAQSYPRTEEARWPFQK
jgi:hypothetical protein